MVEVDIRQATLDDAVAVAYNLRWQDIAELQAMRGEDVNVRDALVSAVRRSSHCWAACKDGAVLAVFGVAPISLLEGLGSPWLLATPQAERCAGALVKQGREYISIMQRIYPRMVNFVDARNRKSIRWLKRLGFVIHDPAPVGVMQLPFHKFEMRD